MIYQKQDDLLLLKALAGLTYRDLAPLLGISPGGVAQKLCGFVAITSKERQIIANLCNEAIKRKKEAANEQYIILEI
jgi:hypothetical protein